MAWKRNPWRESETSRPRLSLQKAVCGGCKPASYHLRYAISNRLCCVSIISRKRRFSSVMQLFPATFSLAGYILFHCGSINDVFLRGLVFLSFSFFFEIPIYFINFYKLLLFLMIVKKCILERKFNYDDIVFYI